MDFYHSKPNKMELRLSYAILLMNMFTAILSGKYNINDVLYD